MRYNWKVTRANSWEDLFQQAYAEMSSGGYRISHIATTGPGVPFVTGFTGPLPAVFDVVWTCDDDSNFVWGVDRVPTPFLATYEDTLRELERRPICLVSTGNQHIEADICVVWIQDRKYLGNLDWKIVTELWDSLQPRLGMEAGLGYRPITATSYTGRTTMIMVRDCFEYLPHVVRLYSPGSYDFDPIAAFHTETGLMPMCVECKSYPYWLESTPQPLDNLVVVQLWTIVGIFSQDVTDNVVDFGLPEAWTWKHAEKPPSAGDVEGLQATAKRIHASVTYWTAAGGWHRTLTIQCRYFPPKFRAMSCTSPANPEPGEWETECNVASDPENPGPWLPGAPFVCYLDALVWDYMSTYGVSALSIAVQDSGNTWRLRRGYTYAPWEFENTYPDSQFRIGSLSKVITKLGVEFAHYELGLLDPIGLQHPIFSILPPDYWPLAGDDWAYPKTVFLVQVAHLITHYAGWDQSEFDPNNNHKAILDAYTAAHKESGISLTGWRSVSDNALLPLVRDDSQHYMLREPIFKHHPQYTPGPNSQNLNYVTGWNVGANQATPYVPGSDYAYSGYGYDLLGLVLEHIIPDGPTPPRQGYKNYVAWIRKNLLNPLSMRATSRGRTARARAKRAEVCYPNIWTPPVELTLPSGLLVHSTPFSQTQLYSAPSEDWYQAGDYPADLFVAPQYGTWDYGGFIRMEKYTPGGGWVGSAPDLCRLYKAVLVGEGSPFSNPTIAQLTAGAPVDVDGVPHFEAFGAAGAHLAWHYVNLITGRRIAVCTNKLIDPSPLLGQDGALRKLIEWAGL